MSTDLEKRVSQEAHIHGYPSLAAIIASDPSAAVFRRFDYISARTLLYMQSELTELEAKLQEYELEDLRNESDEATEPYRDWDIFKRRAACLNTDGWAKRMNLVLEIRQKLKSYRKGGPPRQNPPFAL
jgi:hypothetical protein